MEIIFSPVAIVGGKYSGVIVSLLKEEKEFDKSDIISLKEEVISFLDKQYLLGYIDKYQFDFYLKKMFTLELDTRKHMYYFRWFFKTRPPFKKKRQPGYKPDFVFLEKKSGYITLDNLQATPLFFSKLEGKKYVELLFKADIIDSKKHFELTEEIEQTNLNEVFISDLN
jgi:hypothetical protein